MGGYLPWASEASRRVTRLKLSASLGRNNMTLRTLFAAGMLAVLTYSPSVQAARANGNSYDLVCVWNDTDRVVNFSYQGNNDSDWKDVSLKPGSWQGIFWNNDQDFHSVTVEFDSDPSSQTSWDQRTIYPISAASTNCDKAGADYTFDWTFDDQLWLFKD